MKEKMDFSANGNRIVSFIRSFALILVLLLVVAGCATVVEKIVTVAENDFTRTSELAAKYGKSEVQSCAAFMAEEIGELKRKNEIIKQLRAEDTSGLVSRSFKLILMADLAKQISEEGRARFRFEFPKRCGAVSNELLLRMLEDAAGIATMIR